MLTELRVTICHVDLHEDTTANAGDSPFDFESAIIRYSPISDEMLPWGDVPARAKRPDAIGRVVSFAQARPGQRLDVAALASAAGYSRHHFSRLFRASEGASPACVVLRLRMEEAVSALRSSQSPIKAVAELCGFADANYFAKVFRRSFGM